MQPKDVVRWNGRNGKWPTKTGVVLRVEGDMACVVSKGWGFGVWYFLTELKRIGRVL